MAVAVSTDATLVPLDARYAPADTRAFPRCVPRGPTTPDAPKLHGRFEGGGFLEQASLTVQCENPVDERHVSEAAGYFGKDFLAPKSGRRSGRKRRGFWGLATR